MDEHATRESLLLRIEHDPGSAAAWEEFVRIYSPQVLRWCRACGLQENDAADISQDVLLRFWKQAANFHYDPSRRFRHYLRQIMNSALHGWSARNRFERPLGRPPACDLLDSLPAREDLLQRIEAAYDAELLAIAMQSVRARVSPHTWQAFELQAIDRMPSKEVAAKLGISLSLAYTARHNVQKMLRETIARLEGSREPCGEPAK